MFWVLASIVVVLVLFVALGYSKSGWKLRGRQLIALLGFVVVLGGMVATVPTGHTGILTTFGKVEDKTLEAGMHIKSPFQEIVCMDNRTQVAHLELSAFSSDIQEVLVSYSMNYQIEKSNAQKIYKEIGVDYYNTVMAPRIQEVVKSVIAKYTAEDLIESREALSVQITNSLIEQLGAYNIVVVSTAVEDIDFSDAFTASVEDKVVAEQALLKAQTEQAQKTMEEEKAAEREKIKAAADAEVKEIQAAADAEVAKIKAAAEAEAQKLAADAAKYAGEKEAEANKALAESLTEALIKYYEALGWDGKLPETVVSGTDTILPVLGGGTVNTPAEGSN
ncbi:MAG: prohibitin family protein [Clostridia bacterium]|nr:prohibitin family protein [Clostridia bacterium]